MENNKDNKKVDPGFPTWQRILGILLLFLTVHLTSCQAAITSLLPG